MLSAVKGQPATGTFVLIAVGGPVNYVIHNPNAKVTVSPASGSLRSAGSFVNITVTVRSTVALDDQLTVDPGDLVIAVLFRIRA